MDRMQVLVFAVILIVLLGAAIALVSRPGGGETQGITIRAATLQGGISTLDLIEAYKLLGDEGYNLSVLRLQKTPDIIAALANNETDLAVIPAEMAGKLIQSGQDVRIIAVEMLQNQAVLVKNDSISSPQQLKGQLVGAVVASGTYKMFKAYMSVVYNISVVEGETPQPDVITVVNVPPGSILSTLNTEQIAAVVIWEPFVSLGLAQGDRILVSYSDLWSQAGLSGDPVMLVWVARGEFVDNHPDAVNAFIKAKDKAVQIWETNRSATYRVLADLYRLDNQTLDQLYQRTTSLLVTGNLTSSQVESIRNVWWLAWKGGYLEEDPATIPDTVFYQG